MALYHHFKLCLVLFLQFINCCCHLTFALDQKKHYQKQTHHLPVHWLDSNFAKSFIALICWSKTAAIGILYLTQICCICTLSFRLNGRTTIIWINSSWHFGRRWNLFCLWLPPSYDKLFCCSWTKLMFIHLLIPTCSWALTTLIIYMKNMCLFFYHCHPCFSYKHSIHA